MPASQGEERRRADTIRLFAEAVAELHTVLDRLGPHESGTLHALATAVFASWRDGGKLLVCGNGGSAADAQHIVAELVGRFLRDRQAYPALALTTNTSVLTSVGNDYGFEAIFARQVAGLGRPGDVLLVISTSGDSPNCIEAVAAARRLGLRIFGFLGKGGGQLRDLVDGALIVPSDSTPKIQEVHITMGHLLCRILERWQEEGEAADGGADA
jgi:D-sedoheptulose 7-phosphate isomerase